MDDPPPLTTKTRRSEVDEAAFVERMRAVFAAIFCTGAAQVAVLTHWLARTNAFGRESMRLRFSEYCAVLGPEVYKSPEEMNADLFVMRHGPSAYKVAAHLFVSCFFGLTVSMLFFIAIAFGRALAQLPPSEHLYSPFFAYWHGNRS